MCLQPDVIWPTTLSSAAGCGRCFRASRNVEAGECILHEARPLLASVRHACMTRTCANCFRQGEKLSRCCSKCGRSWYCSDACAEEDKLHESECSAVARLQAASSHHMALLRLVIRVLANRDAPEVQALNHLHSAIHDFKRQPDWNQRQGRYRKICELTRHALREWTSKPRSRKRRPHLWFARNH